MLLRKQSITSPCEGRDAARAGFTLMEITIGVGILSALASLIFPNIIRAVQYSTLQSEGVSVALLYAEARMRALVVGEGSAMRVVVTGGVISLFQQGGQPQLLRTVVVQPGVAIVPATADTQFTATGAVAGTSTLVLRSQNHERIVVVSEQGVELQ